MKLAIVLLFAASAYGAVADYEGWNVPQLGGGFKYVTRQEYESEAKEIDPRAPAQARFFLYTKSNPTAAKEIAINDVSALTSSKFNKAHPTRFVIHGWTNNYQSDVNVEVRSALLASGDYNVFCVDWSTVAAQNYNTARNSVSTIGGLVANFIDFLNEKGGMPFTTLQVVGHSLGAHVSGYTGKLVKRGKVSVIVGLDAALPLFSINDCKTRLCSTDAGYVESIHTNGGGLGFLDAIGTGAFYPNGGKKQPGCGLDIGGGCSHGRAYQYFAEAIRKNDFPSMKCQTQSLAVASNCGTTYSTVRMGGPTAIGASGYYYVPVNSKSPFGMG